MTGFKVPTLRDALATLPPEMLNRKSCGVVVLFLPFDEGAANASVKLQSEVAVNAEVVCTSTLPEEIVGAVVCLAHQSLHGDEDDDDCEEIPKELVN